MSAESDDREMNFGILDISLYRDDFEHLHENPKLQGSDIPFQIDGHELYVSISIGVALYPVDGETIDALIKNADIAMYDSKAKGRKMTRLDTLAEVIASNRPSCGGACTSVGGASPACAEASAISRGRALFQA